MVAILLGMAILGAAIARRPIATPVIYAAVCVTSATACALPEIDHRLTKPKHLGPMARSNA
jgi:hypothetical protein